MHLIKALVLALLLFHIFMNAAHPLIWAAVSVSGAALLFFTGTSSPAAHLRKNIFIISFAVFFSCFIALSSVIHGEGIDIQYIALTAFRIIMVFNIIMLGTMWSG